ncbi:MAG: hypothetical protein IPL46_06120 [Saprospiraceae bacterium]|nr:hypothetical protein [Saprospiraceae bacterium]
MTPDCAKCHTVSGFAESNFTIEDHNQTDFILNGAHMATPCFSCHLKEEKWEFRNIGSSCADCHDDVHEGILDTKFYPQKQCDNCHTINAWPDINFDHNQTNFALGGKHLEQQCNACHLVHGIDSEHQLFSGLTSRCMDCHEDVHQSQFLMDGVTDCSRCHAFDDWEAKLFNHNETDFKLEGEHLRVDCIGCHKPTEKKNISYIKYQIEDHTCAACHL